MPDDDENMSDGISGSMNAAFSSLLITSMYGFLYCFYEVKLQTADTFFLGGWNRSEVVLKTANQTVFLDLMCADVC